MFRGELIALTGPSGSGKSTFLSIVAGWVVPTAGRVERIGLTRIRWVFQNPYGQPRRLVRDHVTYPLLARGLPRQEADVQGERMLDRFGLGDRGGRPFSELSGGEAQRLMLARAMAAEPDLLLVDEPTAQLDRSSAGTVNAVLGELACAGSIVLVASHDEATVRACQNVIELSATR
jgi:ABC-type lipoprotein export system ATPase subunit